MTRKEIIDGLQFTEDTHFKIQQLALYTRKPINKLVEMLLVDALSRVELVESEEKND